MIAPRYCEESWSWLRGKAWVEAETSGRVQSSHAPEPCEEMEKGGRWEREGNQVQQSRGQKNKIKIIKKAGYQND